MRVREPREEREINHSNLKCHYRKEYLNGFYSISFYFQFRGVEIRLNKSVPIGYNITAHSEQRGHADK